MVNIYRCAFTKSELFSDAFKTIDHLDGLMWAIKSRKIIKGTNIQIAPDDFDDETSEKVIDLVDAYRYEETGYTKKDFGQYLKAYIGLIKKRLIEKHGKDSSEVKEL